MHLIYQMIYQIILKGYVAQAVALDKVEVKNRLLTLPYLTFSVKVFTVCFPNFVQV